MVKKKYKNSNFVHENYYEIRNRLLLTVEIRVSAVKNLIRLDLLLLYPRTLLSLPLFDDF